jgi:hypothetical protein
MNLIKCVNTVGILPRVHAPVASGCTQFRVITTPEALARLHIDAALTQAGWTVQNRAALNVHAHRGVAVREFALRHGHGAADYLLFVDQEAVGAVEAKQEGTSLTGVEVQTEKYSLGLPPDAPASIQPLPFLYQSTGIETRFTNGLDPNPRSRCVFDFHRPETLAEWLATAPSPRTRLQTMPAIVETGAMAHLVDGGEQPGTVPARRPATRTHPDGDWQWQKRTPRSLQYID